MLNSLKYFLKTKIVVFTILVILLSIWSVAFVAQNHLKLKIENLTTAQQLSTTTIIADQIREDISNRKYDLELVAKDISKPLKGKSANSLQKQIGKYQLLDKHFN